MNEIKKKLKAGEIVDLGQSTGISLHKPKRKIKQIADVIADMQKLEKRILNHIIKNKDNNQGLLITTLAACYKRGYNSYSSAQQQAYNIL